MKIRNAVALASVCIGTALWGTIDAQAATVSGAQQVWQPMAVTVLGPQTHETNNSPNPFLDIRLDVTFTGPSGQSYRVPGFYNGDGQGNGQGREWRVNFTPDAPGQWQYQVRFRQGEKIAVSETPSGTPLADDGATGHFTVAERDVLAPGFYSAGRLEYVGKHYLKLRDGGYWIKGGANSPENWLGYRGFDATPQALHRFQPHRQHWRQGDPNWDSPDTPEKDDGKGIIGAMNYLASQHVNSMYFLPMNIGGDGKDTWPFAGNINPNGSSKNDNLHYDISKLAQWQMVFEHAQRLGMMLHFVLNERERENKHELDNGTLGVERKLFYREMVARFAHHNALQWNMSEEYQEVPNSNLFSASTIKAFADHLSGLDPYNHPMTVHPLGDPNNADKERQAIVPFLGNKNFDLTSMQYDHKYKNLGQEVSFFRQRSTEAGRPWVVNLDEIASPLDDVSFDALRRHTIWDVYLAGGNLEWYMRGPKGRRLDFHLEDFRPFEPLWQFTWYARKFLKRLPVALMKPDDGLLSGEQVEFYGQGSVYAQRGEVYAVYLPDTDENGGRLDLSDAGGTLLKQWYNPRTGAFVGEVEKITGGGQHALGFPPVRDNKDWAVVISREPITTTQVLQKLGF